MTIDELIKYYEWRLAQTKDFSDPHWEASERREHREFVERLEIVISLLNELQWYRAQNLIQREDVIGEIEYECHCYQSEILHRLTITDIIEQMPKAEY